MAEQRTRIRIETSGAQVAIREINGIGAAATQSFDKAGTSARKAGRDFTAVDRGLATINRTAGSTFKTLAQFTAATAGIAGVTSVFVSAGRAVTSFEQEMANVSTLVDTSVVSMAGLREEILQLPAELGTSAELARGLYETLSAGVAPAEAVRFVGEAARFATAGLTETSIAVDVLTTIINSYGLAASDATAVSDVLFKTVERGKTTVDELSRTFGRVVPLANELGVSVEELGAATATLTSGGFQTAEAITALRGTFSSFINQAQKFRELGIDIFATVEEGGLLGALQAIREVTDGNQEAIKRLVPDIEAFVAVLSLAGERLDTFTDILEDTSDATGATATAFEKQLTPATRAWRTFTNELDRLANEVAPVVLPVLSSILSFLTDITNATRRAFGGGGGATIETLLGDVERLNIGITALRKAAVQTDATKDAIKELADEQAELNNRLLEAIEAENAVASATAKRTEATEKNTRATQDNTEELAEQAKALDAFFALRQRTESEIFAAEEANAEATIALLRARQDVEEQANQERLDAANDVNRIRQRALEESLQEEADIVRAAQAPLRSAFEELFLTGNLDIFERLKVASAQLLADLAAQFAAQQFVLPLAQTLPGIGGATGGPLGGALAGILGLGIGSLFSGGGPLSRLFGGGGNNRRQPAAAFLTTAPGAGIDFIAGGVQGPFGTVGVGQKGDIRINRLNDIVDAIVQLDEQLASVLTSGQIEAAAEALQFDPLVDSVKDAVTRFGNELKDNDIAKLFGARIDDILTAAFGAEVADTALSNVNIKDLEEVTRFLDEFTVSVAAINQVVDAQDLTDAEQAIRAIEDNIGDLIAQAQKFGLSTEALRQAQEDQLASLVADFDEDIRREILGITSPFELQRDLLAERADILRAEADALDANRLQVEELITLQQERIDLEEQAQLEAIERQREQTRLAEEEARARNLAQGLETIESFLARLTASPSSPLSPTVALANAQAQFQQALRGSSAGDVVSAAQSVLGLGQRVFASGPGFFDLFEQVRGGVSTFAARLAADDLGVLTSIRDGIENQTEETTRLLEQLINRAERSEGDNARLVALLERLLLRLNPVTL